MPEKNFAHLPLSQWCILMQTRSFEHVRRIAGPGLNTPNDAEQRIRSTAEHDRQNKHY